MFTSRYTEVATHLARLAATSTTHAEANHWWGESDRFEALAELADVNPGKARATYRPTHRYNPEG